MAEIDIKPLDERLSEDEIVELYSALDKHGAPHPPKGTDEQSTTVVEGLDDDVLTEFLDRLEVHDLACEIYLPVEFEGRIEAANVRVGSAAALVDVLEEMRDEMFADEDEDEDSEPDGDEDEVEDEAAILEGKLRHVWKLFFTGATAAIERHLPLDQLGSHVLQGSRPIARLAKLQRVGNRQAEVDDLYLVLAVDHHVTRIHIMMNKPGGVDPRKTFSGLDQ